MENKHEFLWGCGKEPRHPDGLSAVPTALQCQCGARRADLPGRAGLYLATKHGRKGKGKETAGTTVV